MVLIALGTSIKRALYLSTLPLSALQFDCNTLTGIRSADELKTELWPSILKDLKNNIQLSGEQLKAERISKLKNRPNWELDEMQREYEYLAKPENIHLRNDDGVRRLFKEIKMEIYMKKNH